MTSARWRSASSDASPERASCAATATDRFEATGVITISDKRYREIMTNHCDVEPFATHRRCLRAALRAYFPTAF